MIDIPTWTKRWIPIKQLDNSEISKEDNELLLKKLNKNIKNGLKKIDGFSGFFPIQLEVIPYLLKSINCDINNYYSSDICISVPTGEGKTLCYIIPIANYLYNRLYPHLSTLVIVPTRELANQVKSVFNLFTRKNKGRFPIKIITLTGQQLFLNEMEELDSIEPDVVISTPGRLCEHYDRLILNDSICNKNNKIPLIFQNINFIVIDEIDRLLSQTYNNWVTIINNISKEIINGQNIGELTLTRKLPIRILLSATISNNSYKLNQLDLIRPIYFITSITGESNIPSRMYQKYIKVNNKKLKPEALLCLIYQLNLNRQQRKQLKNIISKDKIKTIPKTYKEYFKIVIFCSNKETTTHLTKYLQNELSKEDRDDLFFIKFGKSDDQLINEKISQPFQVLKVEEFSSLLLQRERNLLIKKFKNNIFNILVCSDILSRGIDISDIDIVINYDVPNNIKTYIHRAGRTARAGRPGYTYTIVESTQVSFRSYFQEKNYFNNFDINRLDILLNL